VRRVHAVDKPAADEPEAHFDLAIGDGGMRFKLAEGRLALTGEGLGYELDGLSELRLYQDLRSVRIQSVQTSKNGPPEARIELVFENGKPLVVHSSSPWGADDPARDPVFIAFVEDLHRRIPPADAARIRFLRGASETQHQVLMGAFTLLLVLLCIAGTMILYKALQGAVPFMEATLPLLGLAGLCFWIYRMAEKNRPGVYRPDELPRDLFP
jgi:hypothetical protein